MTIVCSDTFNNAGTAAIVGRAPDNGLGGDIATTWSQTSLKGNGLGGIVGTSQNSSSFALMPPGDGRIRVRVDPNGASSSVAVFGRQTSATVTVLAVMSGSNTLSIRDVDSSATTRISAAFTYPTVPFWLELELVGLVAAARVYRESDMALLKDVSFTFPAGLNSMAGQGWGFGYYQSGFAAIFDSMTFDDMKSGAPPDTTPPVLTGATGTATNSSTVKGSVTTSKDGQAWAVFTSTATKPTAAQVKDGKTSTGAVAPGSATANLLDGINSNVFTFSGLSANGYMHVVQDDTVLPVNTSTVVSSALVTLPTPDTTAPVLTGAITATGITQESYTLSWPTGTDNVAIDRYEVSLNGGTTWVSAGNSTTYAVAGRTPGALDAVRVRAVDTSGNLSSPVLSGNVQLQWPGVLGATITANTGAGTNGPGLMYDVVGAGEAADRFECIVSRYPNNGVLVVDPDGAFVYTGTSDTFDFQAKKNGTLVNGPNANKSATVTLTFMTGADTTPPLLLGSITVVGKTQVSFTVSCPAGSDDVGVARHDWSKDGGATWEPGTAVHTFNGLTASTAYQVRARAVDTSGNVSAPPLALTVTTDTPAAPTLNINGLKNNAGTLHANLSGITAYVYTASSGVLLTTFSGVATNSAGALSLTGAGIAAGTMYRVILVLASGAEGLWKGASV